MLGRYVGNRSASPTPTLLQSRVRPESELRVYHVLGSNVAVGISGSGEDPDVRLLPPGDVQVSPARCPDEVADRVTDLCHRLQLCYAVFDFLVADGKYRLVDITPNGQWTPYEPAEDRFLTRQLGELILARATDDRS